MCGAFNKSTNSFTSKKMLQSGCPLCTIVVLTCTRLAQDIPLTTRQAGRHGQANSNLKKISTVTYFYMESAPTTIQPFNHSTIQPVNRSTIQPFDHSTTFAIRHSRRAIQRIDVHWHSMLQGLGPGSLYSEPLCKYKPCCQRLVCVFVTY